MKKRIAYGIQYRCPNCHRKTFGRLFVSMFLGFLRFDRRADECVHCNRLYIDSTANEFYTLTKVGIVLDFIKCILSYAILFLPIILFGIDSNHTKDILIFLMCFYVFLLLLYILYLKKKIKESKTRLNDVNYLCDLLFLKDISIRELDEYHSEGIIDDEIYKTVKDNKMICKKCHNKSEYRESHVCDSCTKEFEEKLKEYKLQNKIKE